MSRAPIHPLIEHPAARALTVLGKRQKQNPRNRVPIIMPSKVLVVEDDLLNRMFYHEVLQGRGFEVAMVSDGAAVMDEVERFEPDLITMDIQLPHISGLRLIRKLQMGRATKAIPIIAITAFAGKGEEERIRSAGARAYLAKPVTIPRLVSAVDALLAG